MAVNKTGRDIGKVINDALQAELQRRLNKVYDGIRDQLLAELEAERDVVIAKVALRVSRYFQIETAQDRVVISVETSKL